MSRRRWKLLNSAKARETAQALQVVEQEQQQKATPPPQRVDSVFRNPVEIYSKDEKRWMVVDESQYDFPLPVKMKVTPDWALQVLTERNNNNRNVRDDRVEKYIADLVHGNWEVINNGIGFYKDGTLADGQHRLWGIVESQQTVDVIVVFGMSKSAIAKIDEGAPRSTKDVATMMGLEASHTRLSVTNYLLEQRGTRRTTPRGEQIAFYERHKDGVEFVVSRLKKQRVAKAPVMAAILRAWYNVDRDKLSRFCEVMDSGMANDKSEHSPILLREWLLRNNNNSGPFRLEMYRKTEGAICAFMEGRAIEKLYQKQDEQFPLPEEKLEGAAA